METPTPEAKKPELKDVLDARIAYLKNQRTQAVVDLLLARDRVQRAEERVAAFEGGLAELEGMARHMAQEKP